MIRMIRKVLSFNKAVDGISLKNNRGISLVEVMVVVTVFSILAIISTRAVLLTLRGSQKSDAAASVRENLDFALSVMERLIRNAATVSCTSNLRVDYTDQNGEAAYFSCENVGESGYIASSSARLTSTEVSVTACNITCVSSEAGIPPSVEMDVTAKNKEEGTYGAQVSAATKILLRTY